MIKVVGGAVAGVVGLVVLLAVGVTGAASAILGDGDSPSQPSPSALADIPSAYLTLYQLAASTCPGLDWSILAAIGKVETNHGRSNLPGVRNGSNSKGAEGPMQFLPATFAEYDQPVPPDGVNPPSPYDPTDAIYAAARILCTNGARNDQNISGAIFSYNHSQTYVSEVLAQAAAYKAAAPSADAQTTSAAAEEAINYAEGQIGLPYEWGGNGPQNGDAGFDCSGLTKASYEAAGIELPRTAQTQYDAGPKLGPDDILAPGDLVFYGTPSHIHHVGIYIGNGKMINAPDFGKPVQIDNYRWTGDDYAGARRVTN